MGVSSITPAPELRSKKNVHHKKKISAKADLGKRQVKFNDVEVVEYEITLPCLDKANLWWTRDERRDILDSNQRLAREYRSHHRDQITHANDVFEQCCEDDDPESLTGWLGVKIDLPTHVRGLEWAVLPKFKAHRRVHVQEVLKAQDEQSFNDFASFAVESSRACVAFARIMGQCDANSAAKPSTMPRRRPRMLPSWW
jgi:hypothetical protein